MWLDRILAVGIETIPAPLQVKVLNSRGSIAFYQEDSPQAHASFQRAMTLAQEISDHWGLAFALDGLGAEAANRGDYAAAIAYSTRSLQVSQSARPRLAQRHHPHQSGRDRSPAGR